MVVLDEHVVDAGCCRGCVVVVRGTNLGITQTHYPSRVAVMAAGVFAPNEYKELKGFFDKVKADDDQPALVKFSQNVAIAK